MESLTKSLNRAVHRGKPCVVCGRQEVKSLYTYCYHERTSDIVQCVNCGHLYMDPVPLVELNTRTMDGVADSEFWGNAFLQGLHERLVFNREIRAVRKFLPGGTPRLLDIGSGTGWATFIWQKNRFAVTGLEPSLERTKRARELYRIPVVHSHIENFSTTELYDIVVMRHLLEHIEHPDQMLRKVRSFLKPGGLLLIIIPNINSIGRHLFRENWEWVLPWHLHFYTPKTLSRLLEKVGFEKLKVYQMPSPLWYPHTINKALFGSAPRFKFPHIIAVLLSLPIVFLGMLLNLNDNMTLIFRNSASAALKG